MDGDGTPLEVQSVAIHVFAWRRPASLKVLLAQLAACYYQCAHFAIDFHIHIDGGANAQVVAIANRFDWKFGVLHLDIRTKNVGLREMWLGSLRKAAIAAGRNSLMIVFEDDMRVSIFWFQWLLRMVWRYGRNPTCRSKRLMEIVTETHTSRPNQLVRLSPNASFRRIGPGAVFASE